MEKTTRWLGSVACAVAVASGMASELKADNDSYNFPYPGNRLGWADGSGRLSIWVNGNWKVDLSNGETLPLRFHFSSMQNRIGEGILGLGWWIPLLESTVVQQSERRLRMTTLGGQSVYLYAVLGEDVFRSRDQHWEGKAPKNGIFEIKGLGGWVYRYSNGRIVEATSRKGKAIQWVYGKDSVFEHMASKEGDILLKLARDRKGLTKSIQFADGREMLSFEHAEYPLIANTNGIVGIIGSRAFASKITNSTTSGARPNDWELNLHFEREGIYKLEFNHFDGDELEKSDFTWSVVDGLLMSDSESVYTLRPVDGIPVGKLQRVFTDGRTESYLWDPKKSVAIIGDSGKEKKIYYISSPSDAFKKISKIVKRDNAGVEEIVYRAYYDEAGRKMREVREGIEEFYKYENGRTIVNRAEIVDGIRRVSEYLKSE